MTYYLTVGIMTTILLVSACAATPGPRAQNLVELGASYARQIETAAGEISDQWWGVYEDEELNTLIQKALQDNPSLNQTRKRLEQAAAVARREFSDLLPDLTGDLEKETSRGDSRTASSFTLTGAASYELDIWGKNRAGYKSQSVEADASAEDIKAFAITLAASITETWLGILAVREEETVLNEQIEINELLLDLQHKRYANGAADALDVLQQKELLARSRSQLPDLQSQQELSLHQLAVLVGDSPSTPPEISAKALPATVPLPDAGIPAELIERRPDIKAAWFRLQSADWAAEEAWADRLPSFNITAGYTSLAGKFAHLTNAWLLNLASSLSQPLFDGGQRRAEERRTRALADERFESYKETVLEALAEVEDALSLNHHQERTLTAIKDQLSAARDSLEQAQISYSNGDEDYISVLNSLLSVQDLERQLVRERLTLALNRTSLYRALGFQALSYEGDVHG